MALGLSLVGPALALTVTAADAELETVRASERAPSVTVKEAGRDRERGLRFRPAATSQLKAIRYYRVAGDTSPHVARLWSPAGDELARVTVPPVRRTGWQKVALAQAVVVSAKAHVVSFGSRAGSPYAVDRRPKKDTRRYRVLGGAIGAIGQLPARPIRAAFYIQPVLAAAPPPTSFPNAANTGVPDTAKLTPYNGPGTITTPGTVIDGKQVPTYLTIETTGVVIKNSFVNGNILVPEGSSVSISDTTIDGGHFNGSAVGQYGITMRRVEVIGARQSVSCNDSCDIQDSWLHAQYMEPGSDWHGDGFISNGGEDMLIRHNTLACDSEVSGGGGACSAAVALFADFNPLTRITIDGNLFAASPAGYCLYGGNDPAKPYGDESTYIVVTNNVFQRGGNRKCGVFGAVAAIAQDGEGNVYDANYWDDGRRVRAY